MNPLPDGTIRVRTVRGRKFRAIKYTGTDGVGRWMTYARWWWLTNKGPIPRGFHVLHMNGKSMDDRPENYDVGNPSDAQLLAYERNPEKGRRRQVKANLATVARNRDTSAVRRATGYLKSSYYPVDHTTKTIHNRPQRYRWQVWDAMGLMVLHNKNGKGADSSALGWPGLPVQEAIILSILAGGPLLADELARRANLARTLRGMSPTRKRKTMVGVRARLRRVGLVTVQRRGRNPGLWSITDAALVSRWKWTPIVPMRGDACRVLEQAGYRKDDAPKSSRVDARDAMVLLARAISGTEHVREEEGEADRASEDQGGADGADRRDPRGPAAEDAA